MNAVIEMYLCKKNDFVWARDSEHANPTWTRVVKVDHELGHPVRLDLVDGTKIVGDARARVHVRRLVLIRGGK